MKKTHRPRRLCHTASLKKGAISAAKKGTMYFRTLTIVSFSCCYSMYSPTQSSFGFENSYSTSTGSSSPPISHHPQQEHPFVPTPSSSNSRRNSNSRLFNQHSPPIPHPSSSYQLYQRRHENSFGAAAASMALNPSGGRSIPFADAHTQHNWFGNSLDSAIPTSPTAFGQPPLFQEHDLAPSTSTSHIDGSGGSFTTGEEDEVQQRK